MSKKKEDKWVVRWMDDYVHKGARYDLLDMKGNWKGRLEILSQPEIEYSENEGYVTIKMKACCNDEDGNPISGRNISRSQYSELYEIRHQLYDGLVSFRYVLEHLVESLEEKLYLPEYFNRVENSRSSVLFHYVLLEKQMAEAFPEYLVRLRRIVFLLDEAFEMSIEKLGSQDIYTKSIQQFKEAFAKIQELETTISEK